MKKLAFIIACLAFQSAQAGVVVHCEDIAQKNTIDYADQKLSYSFKCDEGCIDKQEGVDVQTASTVMGTMVSAEVDVVPDQETHYLSLLVPDINLDEEVPATTFTTTGMMTVAKTTFAGPAGVKGAVQSSKFFYLNCTASLAK